MWFCFDIVPHSNHITSFLGFKFYKFKWINLFTLKIKTPNKKIFSIRLGGNFRKRVSLIL